MIDYGAVLTVRWVQTGDTARKGGGIMEVGAQIRKYRMDRNLSQEELAERVYVTRQTVSNWETGLSQT